MTRTAKYLLIILLLIVCVTLYACYSLTSTSTSTLTDTSQPATTSLNTITTPTSQLVPTISTIDAYNLIQQNSNNSNLIIIDVRTTDEFNNSHLASAINIDYYSPDFKSNVSALDKNKQYLVYCRTGVRSAAATQIMLDLGFKDVLNMNGGITQWQKDGYPTVK